jgi:two-component system response regulator RegA
VRILVIEDHTRLRTRLARAFRERGHEAFVANDRESALSAIGEAPTHAVVDLRLGDEDGLEVFAALREALPDLVGVVLTGYGSIATAVHAVRLGIVDVLQKPVDADRILAALQGETSTIPADYNPPTLARAEWEHIQRVLEDCDGNISEAARQLGLHRRTLQRKLQKLPPRE